MRQFIKQPPKSKLCGQIALAHLLGVSLEHSAQILGHRHCTKSREMVVALRALRKKCPGRLQPVRGAFSMRNGLAKLKPATHSWWHWVAIVDGLVWDGAYGIAPGAYCWPEGARITSILPVEGL